MAFTVDSASTSVRGLTAVLRGTKNPDQAVSVNGSTDGVVNLTSTTWQFTAILSPGANTFEITADNGTIKTLPITETVTLPKEVQTADFWFGTLDRYGIVLALDRNPGERNLSYKNRLLDVFLHPGSSTVNGLINAISREVGILVEDDVLEISAATDSFEQLILENPSVEFTQTAIFVDGDNLIQEDEIQVENADLTLVLTEIPANDDIRVFTLQGNEIPPETYDVDLADQKLTFSSRSLGGTWVRVVYRKRLKVSTWEQTLAQVVSALNSLTLGSAAVVSASSTGDQTRSAEGLASRESASIAAVSILSGWSPVVVRELGDKEFQELLLNSDGTAFETQLERWAEITKVNTRIAWGLTILDVDTWDTEAQSRPSGALPHLWDAIARRWYAGGSSDRLSAVQHLAYGGYDRCGDKELKLEGFKREQFHSGISRGSSLLVDIVEVSE